MAVRTLSINEYKRLSALKMKKYRDKDPYFLAEGKKVVRYLAKVKQPEFVIVPEDTTHFPSFLSEDDLRCIDERKFKALSSLQSTRDMIALFKQEELLSHTFLKGFKGLAVALDGVQDPGNLGTIIRLCDWLGVRYLICGKGTADIYNPKVVQATAGALFSVKIIEQVDLAEVLPLYFDHIIGTAMGGEVIEQQESYDKSKATCLIFGNEGHGISDEVKAISHRLVLLPPSENTIVESLNVSIAAALLLSKFL